MKSIVISSVVAALVVFSGCSSKAPAVDTKPVSHEVTQVASPEVAPVETETVSAEDSTIESNTNQLSMSDVENKLSTVYFNFDKYNIVPDMQAKISLDASTIKDDAGKYNIRLEGNCDEWGSDEYNFALGLKRANAVKKALIAQGVNSKRITMISYGKSNPVCTAQTKACWAKNRRVDFKLLP